MAPSLLPNTPVKELCASRAISSLPSDFVVKSDNLRPAAMVEETELPMIDFSLLTKGTPDQRRQAIQELTRACTDWGFFVVVNHGISEKLREEMMEQIVAFFDLDVKEKEEYADTGVMNSIRYGTSFNHKVDDVRYWRDYMKFLAHPLFHCPDKPQGLKTVAQEYTACTRNLARELLKAIWESLGLDDEMMTESLNLGSCFQNVVCNLYPPCPQPELAMGLPSHTDHGLITVLYENYVHGLELKHKGRWVRVKSHPNSFLINIGDQLEIVSNGKYKSALHRATVNGKRTRISIVTFVSPSLETYVAPALQLVTEGSPAIFRGMRYGEYLKHQQSIKLEDQTALAILRV